MNISSRSNKNEDFSAVRFFPYWLSNKVYQVQFNVVLRMKLRATREGMNDTAGKLGTIETDSECEYAEIIFMVPGTRNVSTGAISAL